MSYTNALSRILLHCIFRPHQSGSIHDVTYVWYSPFGQVGASNIYSYICKWCGIQFIMFEFLTIDGDPKQKDDWALLRMSGHRWQNSYVLGMRLERYILRYERWARWFISHIHFKTLQDAIMGHSGHVECSTEHLIIIYCRVSML